MMNAMRNDFGISFRSKHVTKIDQVVAQLLVILDDAVVNDGNAIFGNMRMSIAFGRCTVSGPTSMSDANMTTGWRIVECFLQIFYLTDGAQTRQFAIAAQHSAAGRVVAAILKTTQ